MKRMGLSSAFKVSRIRAWAQKRGDVSFVSVEPGLYFKMLALRKNGA